MSVEVTDGLMLQWLGITDFATPVDRSDDFRREISTGIHTSSVISLVTDKTSAALRPYCSQFTWRGPPWSPCSVYPTSTAQLEATSRKT